MMEFLTYDFRLLKVDLSIQIWIDMCVSLFARINEPMQLHALLVSFPLQPKEAAGMWQQASDKHKLQLQWILFVHCALLTLNRSILLRAL